MGRDIGNLRDKRLLTSSDELRKSERRLRQIVEAAPNAMGMINGAGVIEMVNGQTERLFGDL